MNMKTCDAPRCGWDTETETPSGGEEQCFCLSQSVAKRMCFVENTFVQETTVFLLRGLSQTLDFFKKTTVDKKQRLMSGTAKNIVTCSVS